VAAYSQLD